MPFESRRAPLVLNEETRRQLDLISRSRTPSALPKERISVAEETGLRNRVEDIGPGRDSAAQDSVLLGTAR